MAGAAVVLMEDPDGDGIWTAAKMLSRLLRILSLLMTAGRDGKP